jgi:hypothetical protein
LLIVGIVLAVVAVAIVVVSSQIGTIALSAVALIVSLLAILFPVSITGTCMMDTMVCNTTMKPWTIVLGVVGIALSLALLLVAVIKPRGGQPA